MKKPKPKSKTPKQKAPKLQKSPGLLIYFAAGNLLLLLLFGLSAELIAERHWFTLLLAYAPPFLWLIPTLLLFPFALWKRDRSSLVLLCASLVPQPYLLGCHLSLPNHTKDTPLGVLTYNIEHGSGGIGAVASVIRNSQAEVICLQEVSPYRKLSDPLLGLQKALPTYHIVRAGEVAIATILPLSHIRSFPMPGGRQGLCGDITWHGHQITVVAVHLSTALDRESFANNRGARLPGYLKRSGLARQQQTERLIAETQSITGPLLVCGDFNTPPRGQVYRRLATAYLDTFAQSGRGFGWTFPTALPVLRIDYIFTRNLQPYRTRVLPNRASDHRPLLAEVRE